MHRGATGASVAAGARRGHRADPRNKTEKYLEENAGADAVKLSAADLRRIDEVAPKGAAAGHRYNEVMMKLVNA